MSSIRKHKTVIEFLQDFFGEELSQKTVSAFCNISKANARTLFNEMTLYLDNNTDFYVVDRVPHISRPLLWHEFNNAGLFLGGVSSDTAITLLLLNHQIVITDRLHFAVSGMSVGDFGDSKEIYKGYIEFLLKYKLLIEKGIIHVVSDRNAYRMAPVNDMKTELRDPYINNYLINQNKSTAFLANTLGYLRLIDAYDADTYVDDSYKLETYNDVHAFWEAQTGLTLPEPALFSDRIALASKELKPEDIVSIRLTDEAFHIWRVDFSTALQQKSSSEFREIMKEGIRKLDKKKPSIFGGPIKSVTFAVIGEVLGKLLLPDVSLAGSGLGVGIDIIDNHVRSVLNKSQDAAKKGLREHYLAFHNYNAE